MTFDPKKLVITFDPRKIDWKDEPVPKIEDVNYDAKIVVFEEGYIGIAFPNGDSLNPVRWCDDHFHPRWGADEPYGIWAWLTKGTQKKPFGFRTWRQRFEDNKVNEHIILRPVVREGLDFGIDKRFLSKEETKFVTDAPETISDMFSHSYWIRYDDKLAGLVAFGADKNETGIDKCLWIYRIMLGKKFRRQGIANEVMKYAASTNEYQKTIETLTTVVEGNDVMSRLLEKIGFKKTNRVYEDEIIWRMK